MAHKKFITIALSIAIVHFILTSAVSHYIAVQVGSQIGHIVAAGLIEAGEKKTGNAEEAERIYQNMKAKSYEIKDRWKIPELLISLPAKPLMNPLLKEFGQIQINKLIAKEITRDQFRTQGLIIDYMANCLNSISFGFLVYVMLRIFNRYKSRR